MAEEKVEAVHLGIPIITSEQIVPRKAPTGFNNESLCKSCMSETCSSKHSYFYVVTSSCPSYIKP